MLELRAPLSVFALSGETPRSGSAIHSRRPITSRGMPGPRHGKPSEAARSREVDSTGFRDGFENAGLHGIEQRGGHGAGLLAAAA